MKYLFLIASLTLASLAYAQTPAPTPTAPTNAAFAERYQLTLGATYNATFDKGGMDLRAAYLFDPHFGVEMGTTYSPALGGLRNVSFGVIARLPVEKWRLAPYVRLGGSYNWADLTLSQSAATTSWTLTRDLPCQSGGTTVTASQTTYTIVPLPSWGFYVGPGVEWRPFKTGWLAQVGVFTEGTWTVRPEPGPNGWQLTSGVRYAF